MCIYICTYICIHVCIHSHICISTHVHIHLNLQITGAARMIIISATLLCSCSFLIRCAFPSLSQISPWFIVLRPFLFLVVSIFVAASAPSSALLPLLICIKKYWKTFLLYCVISFKFVCGGTIQVFCHHLPSVGIIGIHHSAQLILFPWKCSLLPKHWTSG